MLRLKDESLKERESLLRTLQNQDCNSVTLARRNQAQKAKLKNKVIFPNNVALFILLSSGGDNQDAGQRDCHPEGNNEVRNRK